MWWRHQQVNFFCNPDFSSWGGVVCFCVLFGLWVFLPFGVWMTFCACENLEGKVFAKVPVWSFL
jgi:hypothetical protein